MKYLLLSLLCFVLLAIGNPANVRAYGLTGIQPYWDGPAPTDGIGVRFRFNVADNNSESLKLIFADSRLTGPEADTYLLEYNIYDQGLRYADGVSSTWPMQGTQLPQEASLRVAVPDYNLKGLTGAKSFSATMFPRQTYEIDGIDGLWKTDLITQTNLNQVEGSVVMTRGDLVTNLSGWRVDGEDLPQGSYRQWDVAVTLEQQIYSMAFAFPDANAQWLSSWEPLLFFSEFLDGAGLFRVNYWDFAINREVNAEWQPINIWQVSHHNGSLEDFGVLRSWYENTPMIEFSNDPAATYLPVGALIDITPVSVSEPRSLYLLAIAALTLLVYNRRRKVKRTSKRIL